MLKSFTIRVICLAGLTALTGQWTGPMARAADLPPMRSERPPQFTSDVVISLHAEGGPALGVSISVPYGQFQWLRSPRGYAAAAQFTVVFESEHDTPQIGDVWDHSLLVPDFRATLSAQLSDVQRRTFDVPPGRYRVRVGIRDLNADVESVVAERVDVPDYSRVPLGLTDLELGVAGPDRGFEAVATRRYGENVVRLAARMALFDRAPGPWPRHYPVRYRIVDDTGTEVAGGTRTVTVDRSAADVVVAPDSTDLFIGSYVFSVELGQGRSRWRVERSFEVETSGPPHGRGFERMLEPLSYVAEGREIDWLRGLSPDQQAAGWDEFWHRRDPTPETPRNEALIEFFRRVHYAERHFQTFGPGWRSDMGRIYIKFGPPDQIESRPSNSTDPPLETWYYDHPYRRFVFVDREGFGRFVLHGPAFE